MTLQYKRFSNYLSVLLCTVLFKQHGCYTPTHIDTHEIKHILYFSFQLQGASYTDTLNCEAQQCSI